MPPVKSSHLDDFALLCYVANDLDEAARLEATGHIDRCPSCRQTLREVEKLDRELADLAKDPSTRRDFELEPLPAGDPFRRRPESPEHPRRRGSDAAGFTTRALAASEEATAVSTRILEAVRATERLSETVSQLSLSDPAHRFALLYALQGAGREIAEHTARCLALAEALIGRVSGKPREDLEAEVMVPLDLLLGQAHLLAGQVCLWTSELERAQTHAVTAYRSLGRGNAGELSLAIVEALESQRRSFTGRPAEALTLARRAMLTFEALEVEDHLARARVVEGLALARLGRTEEAIDSYRRAQLVFERLELWSNYVSAVNSIATALVKDGALDEARREYARALRKLSREQHRSFTGFVRQGLGEILFAAGRYREAALSMALAARTYAKSGLPFRTFLASLFEIESWARFGDLNRARHRMELFKTEVARYPALDPSITRQITDSLAGANPDLQRLSELRQEASKALREELRKESA